MISENSLKLFSFINGLLAVIYLNKIIYIFESSCLCDKSCVYGKKFQRIFGSKFETAKIIEIEKNEPNKILSFSETFSKPILVKKIITNESI